MERKKKKKRVPRKRKKKGERAQVRRKGRRGWGLKSFGQGHEEGEVLVTKGEGEGKEGPNKKQNVLKQAKEGKESSSRKKGGAHTMQN